MRWAIKDHIGYVAGFDPNHLCVVSVKQIADAKTFAAKGTATRWLKQYADCGYGLMSSSAEVVPVDVC